MADLEGPLVSKAPQTLIDLRVFLAEQLGIEKRNFGITGRVTPRRPWGYHLGRADIYSDAGMKDRDYSVKYPRDRAGLTNASAGFDIRLPRARLQALTAYLVDLAARGATNPDGPSLLVEVIGPDSQGAAKRWAVATKWKPVKARADHEWHAHLSFFRDTEFVDKRPMFFAFLGIEPEEDLPTLRLGSHGEPVRVCQERLNAHGATPALVVDGDYGPVTEHAVRKFQQAQGLVVDGIVGAQTWEALLVDPPLEPGPGEPDPPDNPEQPEEPELPSLDPIADLVRIHALAAPYVPGEGNG